jgi:hypothetical protein
MVPFDYLERGRVFGYNSFLQGTKRYFDANLTLFDEKDLGGKAISCGGKYGNRFVITS